MKLRQVEPVSADDTRNILLEMGVSSGGARLMAEKALSMNMLIKDVSCAEANVLKQEMLILGGDAAIHRDVITGAAESSDVLLLANRKQIRKLAVRLREQCFSLPEIGRGLRDRLDRGCREFRFRNGKISFDSATAVMGIVNVTPDSFSDGGQFSDAEIAAAHALSLEQEGADMVDIGGESSRPGAAAVTVDEELRRIMPVFERLQGNIGIPVSVDTQHAEVARRALEQGASVINDITGCADPEMAEAAASFKAGVIIMHMQGEPGSMQNDPRYDNVVEDILSFFEKRAAQVVKRGVGEHSIMVDPGIGFGKTVAHNLEILHHISEFSALGFPVLVGASRKSFIGKTLGLDVHERLPADIAVTSFCSCRGADMVRVHDVMQNRAACNMIRLLVHPCEGEER